MNTQVGGLIPTSCCPRVKVSLIKTLNAVLLPMGMAECVCGWVNERQYRKALPSHVQMHMYR